jgi:hypothetical protein
MPPWRDDLPLRINVSTGPIQHDAHTAPSLYVDGENLLVKSRLAADARRYSRTRAGRKDERRKA